MLIADFAFGLADALRRRHFRCRMLAHGALKFPAYCLYLLHVGVVIRANVEKHAQAAQKSP